MTTLVSEGKLVGLDRPQRRIGRTVEMRGGDAQTYRTIYRTQPAVQTCVKFLARNVAHLGLHLFDRVSDQDRVRLVDHPAALTVEQPNPRTTRYRFVEGIVSDLGIYDVAVIVKVPYPGGSGRFALQRIPVHRVEPVGDSWLWPDAYRITGSKGKLDVPPEAVIVFPGYDPETDGWGVSPMEALRQILAEDVAASEYREKLWRSGARISGILTRPSTAPEWSDDAKEQFSAAWSAFYSGNGEFVGGTPILEDDMSFDAAGVTSKDAQYVEARKLTREEVAAAYFIPQPFVGILDHATFSNITEQHKNLYQDTLGPLCERIQSELELQLLRADYPDIPRAYFEFNIAEKLAGTPEEQASAMSTLVGAPVMTVNEARARLNLPRIDDEAFDVPIVPLNVTQGGQASPTDSAPPPKATAHQGAPWRLDSLDLDDLAVAIERHAPKALNPGRGSGTGRRAKARPAQSEIDSNAGILGKFFERQGKAIASKVGAEKAKVAQRLAMGISPETAKAKIDEVFDADRWNGELADDMAGLNKATASAAVKRAQEALDVAEFDESTEDAWLEANAAGVAEGINATTRDAIAEALGLDDPLDAVKRLFEVYAVARAAQIAATQTTAISAFAAHDVARAGGYVSKQWVVTSAKPRASHAAIDGETVDVDGTFSNGGRWPGDSSLSADERAGCTCDLAFVRD